MVTKPFGSHIFKAPDRDYHSVVFPPDIAHAVSISFLIGRNLLKMIATTFDYGKEKERKQRSTVIRRPDEVL